MTNPEYDRFTSLMERLIKVPHSEVKAKLDAEKRTKEQKKKRKAKRASASRASGGKG
jgi:hypothetical protein